MSCCVIASLAAAMAYPALPAEARPVAYFLIALSPLLPVATGLSRIPRRYRGAMWIILAALGVLGVGNLLTAITVAGGGDRGDVAQWMLTIGHVLMLLAALQIVRQRGRDDVGGLMDMAVVAIGIMGTLWTTALQPRLTSVGTEIGGQASLLIIVLSLGGILGAVVRLELVSRQPILALRLLLGVLLLAMVGNISLAWTGTFVAVDRPAWIETLFLLSYVFLGAAATNRSMVLLVSPGPAFDDRLSRSRLVFLGVALGINPVVAGVQQLVGREVDAVLLAVGTAVVVPLVMVRVGWLSSQRLQAERALTHQATHDGLTGLPNRAEFLERLTAALSVDPGDRPPPVVLLFCDLNGFKAVNDRLGHLAGDQLLEQVGRRLAGCVREEDTLARYGGDEFVILCPSPTTPHVVDRVCQRIEHALSAPFDLAGELVHIGVSIGAVTAAPGMDADATIRRADEAMYVAKRNRNSQTSVSLRVA